MPAGSRSTLLIWAVAGVLAVLAGMRLLGGGDAGPPPVAIDRPGAVRLDGAPGSRARPAAEVYVHVAGAVRRPGLMQVPEGARVAMALERAGGPTRRADLTLVNLAARLEDGQQILVPKRGATAAAPGSAAALGSGAPVHLSTATVEQLDAIDGIGPTLAQRIIEFRDEGGGFRSLDRLSQVEGIGEKRLATLREALQP
ncbi:MAG TPA: helix-hairpin-helix domain-containing protein [Thermoleophilaceae bacterium]|nr:helix-hairpin-helix domain-containing protein [Thermoleophilaceae bacterium]